MKQLAKRLLRLAGYAIQRLPPGLPSGLLLERDLALVSGPAPRPLCLAVGANRGDFVALLLAHLAQPVIHAFEPAPGPFAILRQRHAARPGVTLVPAGVGSVPGELSLHFSDNEALNSFLPFAPEGGRTFGGAAQTGRHTAPVITLDAYAADQALARIDLLKIDTQGFDLQVLRGAQGLLQAGRIRNVLVELNFIPLYEGQAEAADVIAWLRQHHLHLVDYYEKCRQGPLLGWCTALFTLRAPAP